MSKHKRFLKNKNLTESLNLEPLGYDYSVENAWFKNAFSVHSS